MMMRHHVGLAIAVCLLLPASESASWFQQGINKGGNSWGESSDSRIDSREVEDPQEGPPEELPPPQLEEALEENEDDPGCVCVPMEKFFQCDPKTKKIITDGGSLVTWRISHSQNKCQKQKMLCCYPEEVKQEPPTPPTLPSLTQDQRITEEETYEPEPQPLPQSNPEVHLGCGERKASIQWRSTLRVSGPDKETETEFAEFPWQMMIHTVQRREQANLNIFICGGSLIDRQFVLTTAHTISAYITQPQTLRVRAGDWNLDKDNEPLRHQDRWVKQAVMHPNFTERNPQHDIALLMLEKPFDLDEHINTICLPEEDYDFVGSRCYGTGWGLDAKHKTQGSLKKAQLPILGHRECQALLRKTRLGERFKLHESFLCAGAESELDMCVGDGGGPLACPVNNIYYQAGITSWGVDCGQVNVPGVFTDVSKHREWIKTTMEQMLQG